MAVVSRRHPSGIVSTGLSVTTVALNVAGAAADAVPIAKQILNSAAHISAVAERIQKKRDAMYMLIQKAEIYSTQIDIVVAGRVLDARLQQRLSRLLSVFIKIGALVESKLGRRHYPVRVWHKFITKPNRAEELAAELDQEMTLFNLLTGIQLSLTVDDTARIVAEDARYDGQFRRLRDCDVEKLDVIHKRETDTDVIVWSSARVDGQLMVIRHIDSLSTSKSEDVTVPRLRRQSPPAPYNEFLKNMENVSTISGSHRSIVQLYGRHTRGPEAVFKSGTIDLDVHLQRMLADEGDGEEVAMKRLTLAYKILDASAHLTHVHGLNWIGGEAIVDENGEPYIGLFDDIIPTDGLPSIRSDIYWNILLWFNYPSSMETGVVEQVHDSLLYSVISEELRGGNDTDRLQRVWDAVRQEQLDVQHDKVVFTINSETLPLSPEVITRARLYFETNTKEEHSRWDFMSPFVRHVVTGRGASNLSQICIRRSLDVSKYCIKVDVSTHDDRHIQHEHFWIYMSAGCPLLVEVAATAGLPDDFDSWNGSDMYIYSQSREYGEHAKEENKVRNGKGADNDPDDCDACGSSGEEEDYETADEGKTSFDAAGEE